MSKQSLASTSGRIWMTVLLLITTCYSLKCRTDDGPSETELKRITRRCMRKIGENMRPNSGGSAGSSSSFLNSNHYGPLHQSSFGAQYGNNARHDYDNDYTDDDNHYNDNNNYNNNNNNNNGNYDRSDRGDNRNVMQQRNRDRQQNNRDNNRSMSSGGYSSSSNSNNNNNNNSGRQENGNNNGGSGGGGNSNSGGSNNGGRNSGNGSGSSNGGSNGGNNQRNYNQNNSNNNNNHNNNNSNNNKNSSNDTVDPACIVHCFFEEMNMLNSDDYPDRYKVQYGLTRDLRDRELRNFYTETIQDCFHYMESQRRRDKCHYSRDLIHCMTEYAKVNCDDWQEFNMVFN